MRDLKMDLWVLKAAHARGVLSDREYASNLRKIMDEAVLQAKQSNFVFVPGAPAVRRPGWNSQSLPLQSASLSPAATNPRMSITTAVPPVGVPVNSRKLLLGKMVTRAVWRTCSLRMANRYPLGFHNDILVDFFDDFGQRQELSVRIMPAVQQPVIGGTLLVCWHVTANCKFPDPGQPVGSDPLQLAFDFTYHPATDRLETTGESWRGDTDANGDLVLSSCDHDWKDYQGLTECYRYCAKCDAKDKNERK